MNLPAGYTTRSSGRGRELERTFDEFVWAFLLSVVFMYMILASQFESLDPPAHDPALAAAAVPFALLSLWLTGNTLNLYSALGILVLFGVVKKNSILQVDHMNNAARDRAWSARDGDHAGQPRPPAPDPDDDARARRRHAAAGARHRPRRRRAPLDRRRRHRRAALSLLLTLLVTPVAYSLFDDLARMLGWQSLVRIGRRGLRAARARR